MKKQYPTVFHETALDYDTIYISGGRIGAQVELGAPGAVRAAGGIHGGYYNGRIELDEKERI